MPLREAIGKLCGNVLNVTIPKYDSMLHRLWVTPNSEKRYWRCPCAFEAATRSNGAAAAVLHVGHVVRVQIVGHRPSSQACSPQHRTSQPAEYDRTCCGGRQARGLASSRRRPSWRPLSRRPSAATICCCHRGGCSACCLAPGTCSCTGLPAAVRKQLCFVSFVLFFICCLDCGTRRPD
jgi:hypothetical protein